MKWIYLPWRYRSADTATKICNLILYGVGILLLISIAWTGYQMFQVHDLSAQEHQAATHRTTKDVPIIVDHQHYDYIYHTNTHPYHMTTDTIQKSINIADHHDLSSYTDRVYWLKRYVGNGLLDESNNPLSQQKIDMKNGFIGMNTTDHDAKNVQFIINGKELMNANDSSGEKPKSVILTGNFDGTEQKITSLNALSE